MTQLMLRDLSDVPNMQYQKELATQIQPNIQENYCYPFHLEFKMPEQANKFIETGKEYLDNSNIFT